MRRSLVFLCPVLILLALPGCGGSDLSGVSEEEAASLLEEETNAYSATCIKGQEGDRSFDCNARNGNLEKVKVRVMVSESGVHVFVTHCEPVAESPPLIEDPCRGIGVAR